MFKPSICHHKKDMSVNIVININNHYYRCKSKLIPRQKKFRIYPVSGHKKIRLIGRRWQCGPRTANIINVSFRKIQKQKHFLSNYTRLSNYILTVWTQEATDHLTLLGKITSVLPYYVQLVRICGLLSPKKMFLLERCLT